MAAKSDTENKQLPGVHFLTKKKRVSHLTERRVTTSV